jgi:UDP-glucose 4-epimerase
MHILVTGGAGYIGSHTVVELLDKGYNVTVIDNLSNSSEESLRRIQEITGKPVTFHNLDVANKDAVEKVLQQKSVDAIIHFAGFKAVGESVAEPLRYYQNNVVSTLVLGELVAQYKIPKFIFSSSATVYGDQPIPYTETTTRTPENPYGNTKFVSELIMEDAAPATSDTAWIALRYFNPVGAHSSGKIGEDPSGIPNNLMPFVAQVAGGVRDHLNIFGDDYDTVDGTGVRDYIHVVDLARGHVAALEKAPSTGFHAYNLGSGKGTSVLELVHAFEKACGKTIPYEVAARRPGDLPLTLDSQIKSSSGRQSLQSKMLAVTPGTGNRKTPTVTAKILLY